MDLREAYKGYIAKYGNIISYGDYVERIVKASVENKRKHEVKTDETAD